MSGEREFDRKFYWELVRFIVGYIVIAGGFGALAIGSFYAFESGWYSLGAFLLLVFLVGTVLGLPALLAYRRKV